MSVLPDPGPIVIVGAGGFGRECLDVVEAINSSGGDLVFLGFADDGDVDRALLGARGADFLGPTNQLDSKKGRFVIGIGGGEVRRAIDSQLVARGLRPVSIWHPSATVGAVTHVGDGSVICAGVRLTTNIDVGRHVHLNLNTTVGHDSVLGDFVTVFPGATISGNVSIGEATTIGTGANILPGVTIGPGAFVGAGALVNKNVDDGVTVAGVPARPLDR